MTLYSISTAYCLFEKSSLCYIFLFIVYIYIYMDFGLVGLDNLVCNNPFSSENSYKHKGDGSERFLKQVVVNEDELREFKLGKTTSPFGETMLKIPLQRSHNLSETTPHPQMLCFSSPNSALPSYNRNTVYGSGEMASASFHGVISGIRGPFTPSQWMELEHQALIYKYITANVPIPSYLLNPIRKAMESAGFHAFSGLRSNALGWGAFHLGFSNTDPEPGRCRRTDGKKWRCSRDAVADQKYCERHMNRGRHRSRKPVEGQSGHSPSSKLTTPPPSSTSASVLPASDTLSFSHHNPQLINTLPPASSDNSLSGISNINRTLLKKDNAGGYQHTTNLSMASPRISLKDNQYSVPQPQNAYEESLTQPEFGLVCSDSLLNPLDKSSSLINCRSYVASDSLNGHENKSQHGLRQFMDDWPKSHSERSAISWPDIELHQPDRTQLSISIPTSDYMSSTSSPTNVKLTASPRELEMGLGVGTISWEASMGGPLGEVLHTSNNECKNGTTKALNLIERWDNSSRLVSSPTGVLQRGAFGSLSNSSAGSSPRAESSRMLDGVSLSNGLTAPGPMHHPSFPAL